MDFRVHSTTYRRAAPVCTAPLAPQSVTSWPPRPNAPSYYYPNKLIYHSVVLKWYPRLWCEPPHHDLNEWLQKGHRWGLRLSTTPVVDAMAPIDKRTGSTATHFVTLWRSHLSTSSHHRGCAWAHRSCTTPIGDAMVCAPERTAPLANPQSVTICPSLLYAPLYHNLTRRHCATSSSVPQSTSSPNLDTMR